MSTMSDVDDTNCLRCVHFTWITTYAKRGFNRLSPERRPPFRRLPSASRRLLATRPEFQWFAPFPSGVSVYDSVGCLGTTALQSSNVVACRLGCHACQ